jgi:hypothetical protein
MRRHLRHLVRGMLLVVLLATGAGWLRSHVVHDSFFCLRGTYAESWWFSAASLRGVIGIAFQSSELGEEPRPGDAARREDVHWSRYRDREVSESAWPSGGRLGFSARLRRGPFVASARRYSGGSLRLSMPYWLPFGVLASPLALWLRRRRRTRKIIRRGLCPTCGYDLRATPDKCPECGHVPAGPRPDASAGCAPPPSSPPAGSTRQNG